MKLNSLKTKICGLRGKPQNRDGITITSLAATWGNWVVLIILAATIAGTASFAAEGKSVAPHVATVTANDLGMERHRIRFSDDRLWIFNGRMRCHASRWSTTGLFDLYPALPGYRFHFDFVEKRSGIRIIDNIDEIMNSQDPLGFNFRPGAPFCMVAQDDTWYRHKSVRTGTFHKVLPTGLASFSINTISTVSARTDAALMSIMLSNRSSEPLTLTLLPVQNGQNLIRLPVGNKFAGVSSDLGGISGEGLLWTLPPHACETHNFKIVLVDEDKHPPAVNAAGLTAEIAQCEIDGQEQIHRIASRLPAIKTESRQLNDLYKRCIASLALCRWSREDWLNNPTWVCGGFLCVVSWDFSFGADTLSLIDPQSVRRVVRDVLGIGQMRTSYIDIFQPRASVNILYLQDPFAIQAMISRYIVITGDHSILDDPASDATIYEWLKRWGDKLHNDFGKGPDGLLDVSDDD